MQFHQLSNRSEQLGSVRYMCTSNLFNRGTLFATHVNELTEDLNTQVRICMCIAGNIGCSNYDDSFADIFLMLLVTWYLDNLLSIIISSSNCIFEF